MVDGVNNNSSIAQFTAQSEQVRQQKTDLDAAENQRANATQQAETVAEAERDIGASTQETSKAELSIRNTQSPDAQAPDRKQSIQVVEQEVKSSPGVSVEVQANQSVDAVVKLVS
jgi:ribosomal protein L9